MPSDRSVEKQQPPASEGHEGLRTVEHVAEWERPVGALHRRCEIENPVTLPELEAIIDRFEAMGCDCCSPTQLDDVLEGVTPRLADKFRAFGIGLAALGQNVLEADSRG